MTVNHTRGFGIGKALHNLPALREVAFAANRRPLHVQKLSHDPMLGDEEFQSLTSPQEMDGQRVQQSVFECSLNNEQYVHLKQQLIDLINMKEDSFRPGPGPGKPGALTDIIRRFSESQGCRDGSGLQFRLRLIAAVTFLRPVHSAFANRQPMHQQL